MAILSCKQSLEYISLQIFSKLSNFKITGAHQFPDLPTLKAYPTPGEGGIFNFFFAEMMGKNELKGKRSIFYPLAARF